MEEQELMEYIIAFGVENNWNEERVPEQIKAFFTTWCFLNRIDADTNKCDTALKKMYWEMALEGLIEYEVFEDFMLELIV